MKISVLVSFLVLPMIISMSLHLYGFISTSWNYFDKDLMEYYNSTKYQQERQVVNNTVQLEWQLIRHAFRSHYSLFGYCLDYKWLYLSMIKTQSDSSNEFETNKKLVCQRCNQSRGHCPETGCCVKRCDSIPDCPSYFDEQGCPRSYSQTSYYWEEEKCMWQSVSIDIQGIPHYVSTYPTSPRDIYQYMKSIRYYIMLLLFIAAPLFTFMGLLILFCITCVDRFFSIPFAFVSFFSLASFVSGSGGLGIFLYEWIQARLHRPEFAYEFGQMESLTVALNPWLIHVERLGLAFWLVVAAVGTNLFISILSCCFCCGLQSDKSKLRIHVNNDKYAIIHTSRYDE